MSDLVVLAGGTGALGGRIARELAAAGTQVRALVRPGGAPGKLEALARGGAEPVAVGDDPAGLERALAGAGCVVSAVNGLEDTVIGFQSRLLDAAVKAGVPRFVPSDFSLDFTRTRPGRNRNLDLRRRFMARVDEAPIRATSVLNGGFADLLKGDAPMVLPRVRRILHWGSSDQHYDFTTMDDVARFTAHAALDADAPRILRIAGDQVSPHDLAATMTSISGRRYKTLRAGGTGQLGAFIRLGKLFDSDPRAIFPAWQGMQYLRDMVEGDGAMRPLDNDRYGQWHWTPVADILRETYGRTSAGRA